MKPQTKLYLLLGLVSIYVLPFACDAANKPVQLIAKINYSRVGGYTKHDKDEDVTSQFNYQLNAQVEQIMLQLDPENGEKYPTFNTINEDKPSFKSSGSAHLTASIDSMNKQAHRHDTAQAELTGSVKNWDDFNIKNFSPILPFADFHAEIGSQLELHGSVTGTFLQMPGSAKEDLLYTWPLPIQYKNDEKRFVSDITGMLYTPALPRPKEKAMTIGYDLIKGTINFTDSVGSVGGVVLTNDNGVLTSVNGGLILTTKLSRTMHTPDGTSYVETFSMEIRTEPVTLPIPKIEE